MVGWLVLPVSGRMVRLVVGVVCLDGQGGGDAVRLDEGSSCQLGRLASGEAVCLAGWLLIELLALMVGWCVDS